MAGKRGGFFSKILGEDGSKAPLTDADRDRWLEVQPAEGEPPAPAFRPDPGHGAAPSGVDITEMSPQSPLGRAGIREGDLITAVNGRSTPTETSLMDALSDLGPGERAEVSVIRDDANVTISVTAPG